MRLTVFLMMAATLTATTARAQPAPWAPERLTAGWVFTPSVVVGGLWDSNVTVRAANDTTPAEWVGLVNPRGELDFNGRRTHFNLGYSGALEAYRQFSELNRYEQRGRFELRHQATSHLQIVSRAGISVAPTTDRLEFAAAALPYIDIGSRNIDASAGIRQTLSSRTRLEADYAFQSIAFDRDQAGTGFRFLMGGHSHAGSVALMRDLSSRTALGVSYRYRHANIGDDEQTFDVQSTAGEFAWQTGPDTTIRAGGGLSYVQATAVDQSAWGPAYHANVEHRVGTTSITARYERALSPSIGFGGVSANQMVGVSARVPFARGRYVVSSGVSYSHMDPVEALGIDFSLDSVWTQTTFGYQFAPWMRAEAFVNGTLQTSSARGEVNRARIGVQFVTSKPVRIQ